MFSGERSSSPGTVGESLSSARCRAPTKHCAVTCPPRPRLRHWPTALPSTPQPGSPMPLLVPLLAAGLMSAANAWDPSIEAYRTMLVADKLQAPKDVADWTTKTRAVREFMAANDPDCASREQPARRSPIFNPAVLVETDPLYHLAAPEGWNNDPNGVTFDPKDGGLYHRFYQVQRSCCCSC